MRKYIILALCLVLCFAAGCAQQTNQPSSEPDRQPEQQPDRQPDTEPEPEPPSLSPWEREPQVKKTLEELTENTIQITITMEDGGVIVADLYPDLAPQSVRNFVYLARKGFYDGLKFHRIMSGFMIQGGCPDGTGTGNPGYGIWGEYEKNGFVNELKHTRGVLSMARQGDPAFNSAGSQFFIMHGTSPSLDGGYAAFGKVTSGIDVVNRIAQTPNSGPDGKVATEDMPIIKSVTVDDDVVLPEPEMLKR